MITYQTVCILEFCLISYNIFYIIYLEHSILFYKSVISSVI